jgi:prepilin-type N-terminal cleavage/methylation domain-containing protein
MTAKRRGFTLIEVMVSLAVGAAAVLVVGAVARAVTMAHRTLEASRRALDHRAVGLRTMSLLLEAADVGLGGADPFTGDQHEVRFTAWAQVPEGWTERGKVRLVVKDTVLCAETASGSTPLVTPVHAVRFSYLARTGPERGWTDGWASALSVPAAVRVILGFGTDRPPDTVLVFLGDRG